jgi:pyruvate kinase
MATKTGKDLEDLRALLAEVQALREDVEKKGAELRRDWVPAAEQATSRATNLSHYIALRSHDLNDLQLRLAARGLSSLGRSEAKVAATLDVLIVTLRRLTGETNMPYPAPRSPGRAPRSWKPRPIACLASGRGAPRACG